MKIQVNDKIFNYDDVSGDLISVETNTNWVSDKEIDKIRKSKIDWDNTDIQELDLEEPYYKNYYK